MKYILLNLKRFDVPVEYGGVNRLAKVNEYAKYIINHTKDALEKYDENEVSFSMFFPEAHILPAVEALGNKEHIKIGSQGVHSLDVEPGKNFGAFTTQRPASIIREMGAKTTLIGHCEERNTYCDVLLEADVDIQVARRAVNKIMNKEIKRAIARGLDVVYCIGEREEEQANWQDVLRMQLEVGLHDVDKSKVVIAYEPIWSIGPGKVPADKEYITKIARFVKEVTGGMDVVYGGGLKAENASMLAEIPEISGGLIALTRFSGEIGFYPEEYLEIIHLYLGR